MVIKILYYVALGYLALLIPALFFANRIIFQPPPSSYNDDQNIIKLTTADGYTISAVYLHNPKAQYVILLSHGNAEDLGYILPFLKALYHHGFSVFAYDYHGYGTSTGKPSEKNAYLDVAAAYDYLTKKQQVPANKIISYGFSVGAGVAIDLASREKVAAVIAQSPFTSAFRVITQITILPFDKFNNLAKIKKINCPLLVIHGYNDFIVPFWHGKKLYNAANEPKRYYWVKGAGHNDLLHRASSEYWQVLNKFIIAFNI